MVYHHGRQITQGHYTADIFQQTEERWVRMDDEKARVITSNELHEHKLGSNPYMLYYQRSDQISGMLEVR